jgi:hypothetical protein
MGGERQEEEEEEEEEEWKGKGRICGSIGWEEGDNKNKKRI